MWPLTPNGELVNWNIVQSKAGPERGARFGGQGIGLWGPERDPARLVSSKNPRAPKL